MPSVLYFDCIAGVAGDMCLGALVDLGCPLDHLRAELATLRLDGYRLRAETRHTSGLRGTLVTVEVDAAEHPRRNLHDILGIIDASDLDATVAEDARGIFRLIGEAEAHVHGVPLDEIHFHEIGAVDSIVDVIGTCIAVRYFAPDALYSSPLKTGRGFVQCAHGTLPVPAPAVVRLAAGRTLEYVDVEGELTTPTGAAILAALTRESPELALKVEAVGYGYGTRRIGDLPNVLRVVKGAEPEPALENP
jgi:uncharacterized protein (TIGR00299 family) protein